MKKFIILIVLVLANYVYSQTIFQDFEDISIFDHNQAPKAKIKTQSIKGYKGKAIRIDFDLTDDHFVEIFRKSNLEFDNIRSFSWYLKGDANGNIIEIKFVDEDGTTFGTKWPITGIKKDTWKKFTLKMRDLHYMWGGDQKVDKIKAFYIAISRGLPRKGYVCIDQFNYIRNAKGEPSFEIQLNQVGYHPTDKKFFIVRILELSDKANITGSFIIKNKNGKNVYKGKLMRTGFNDWAGQFLSGTFNEISKKGLYKIVVDLKIGKNRFKKESFPFQIDQMILSKNTLLKELTYLKYQRCGIRCHKKDPVMGGHHDTLFDISKRMWSIPSLIYGMALYNENGVFHPDEDNDGISEDKDELLWGFDFIAKIPAKDGTVSWGGIEADFEKYMTYQEFIARIGPLKPEDDNIPRIKYKDKNLAATSYNLIALIKTIPLIKKERPQLAVKAEKSAFRAWEWLEKQRLKSSLEYGFYLWAATTLYNYTKDKKYLHKVPSALPALLQMQVLNYNKFENDACGDFYRSLSARDFLFQYKYISFNIAINMALLNLIEILPQNDPLWFDCYYANKVFAENYLKGLIKTPYKQIAHGLELPEEAKSSQGKWEAESDKDASIKLDYKTIKEDHVLDIDFDISKGHWVQIHKQITGNLTGVQKIKCLYQYEGKNNMLEVKMSDQDNSSFGKKLYLSNQKTWKELIINRADLKYMWGGDKKLDLTKGTRLWFALSKKTGGKGAFKIKDVALYNKDRQIVSVPISSASSLKYKLNYFAGPEAEKAAAANHGLNCDHLGLAYIAMRWGQYAEDLELEEFADNQVNWVLGCNPLDYCMLIGAGSKNPIIMAEYYDKPKLDGIIPNGIVGGKNEEPEWWGDGPSSGEDWMPHNAAYFKVLSVMDNLAELSGSIIYKKKPVSKAKVEIYYKKKRVARTTTDKQGQFVFKDLKPQREYSVRVKYRRRQMTRSVGLLSGSKKKLVLSLDRKFKVKIIKPKKVELNKKNYFTVTVSKKAVNQKYVVKIKGAKTTVSLSGKIKSRKIKVPFIPDGDKPLLFRFEILGNPIIADEVYYKAL